MLWVVVLMYQCGRMKEHCVWSMKWLFISLPPSLFSGSFISVMGGCRLRGVGVMVPG